MSTNVSKKIVILTFLMLIGLTLLGVSGKVSADFSGTAKLSMNGNEISVNPSNVDPFVIKAGEQGAGNLMITEFNMNINSITQPIVYTTRWPYAKTPVRENAYEYAFERLGNVYTLVSKSINGNVSIPVNGVVVSSKEALWETSNIGDKLTHSNFAITTYTGAVEIVGTGDYEGPNKSIRMPIMDQNRKRNGGELIYYNNQWGKSTGQNEFGIEVKVTLMENGGFEVSAIRDLRDTKQLEIGSKDFVLSAHGDGTMNQDFRGFLSNGHFINVGDKVNLVGMEFVDLNKSADSTITSVNPTGPIKPTDVDELNGGKYFPGFRGANYLMYYDKDYVKTTNENTNHYDTYSGTNEWGYELLVKIEERTGNLVTGVIEGAAKQISSLPGDDYFILSGNGTQEAFLTQNNLTGSEVKVNLDTMDVKISSTLQSYISTVEISYNVVRSMMQSSVDAKYKLNYILEGDTVEDNKWTRAEVEFDNIIGFEGDSASSMYGLKEAINNFTGTDAEKNVLLAEFNDLFLQGLGKAYEIETMSYSSLAISSIGVWHRPNAGKEFDLNGIKETIKLFSETGVNTVYLETFWNGYSMSDDSDYIDYHRDFKTFTYDGYKDYLDAFIGEAHLAGIEVHSWVENFFVGYQNYPESNILTGKLPNSNEDAPDKEDRVNWVIRDYQGNEYTQFEGGKYKFIDPSNPNVRTFLISYYKELFNNYELDGINLDYIRYPVSEGYGANPVPRDHGYSEYSAARFLEEQGESTLSLAYLKGQLSKTTNFPEDAEDLKAEWDKFKIRQVSEYVKEVYDAISIIEEQDNKDIIISTAVFAGSDALLKKHQDWASWVNSGLIEVTTPMVYYQNSDTVTLRLKEMVNKIDNQAFNYAGIAPFYMGMDPIEEVYQALASIKGNALGTVIFDSKSIINSAEARQYLANGVSSTQTIVPHLALNKLVPSFITEMKSRDGLYELTGDKLVKYNEALDSLNEFDFNTRIGLIGVLRQMLKLQDETKTYASGHSITRINEELGNLYNTVNVRYKRMVNGFDKEVESDKADKTNLSAKIKEVESLESNKYEVKSWEEFTKALDKAKQVEADEYSLQSDVDTATNNLNVAFNNLVLVKEKANLTWLYITIPVVLVATGLTIGITIFKKDKTNNYVK